MDKQNIELKILTKESIIEQVKLYALVFEVEGSIEDIAFFWMQKHYSNPIDKSIIIGGYIDNVLVGMNAYLPAEYYYRGKAIKALQSCESCVHPEYQGRGIWGKVVRYAINYIFENTDYEFVYGFPNYRNSYPGFVKMKWDTIDYMDNYIMAVNPRSFAKSFSNNALIRLLARLCFLQKAKVKLYNIANKYTIKPCDPEKLIWSCFKDTIHLLPSSEWLKWKLRYKHQYSMAVFIKNEIVATFIYSMDKYENNDVIRLDRISYVIKHDHEKILSKIIAFLSNEHPQASFIRVWSQKNSILTTDLKKLYFLKSSHPNPFIIKQRSGLYNNIPWYLSFMDLD